MAQQTDLREFEFTLDEEFEGKAKNKWRDINIHELIRFDSFIALVGTVFGDRHDVGQFEIQFINNEVELIALLVCRELS